MKIFVTGTRGIPCVPGGVEKHCEELYPRIAAQGHRVTLCTRSPYISKKNRRSVYKGVKLLHLYAPHNKSLEAIIHTTLAVCVARLQSPDIVHIHAVGPSLLVPLARLLGLKIVVTNHGPDYDRQKWGRLPKLFLMAGEKLGSIFAHQVVVISTVIADIVQRRCKREAVLIPNGVNVQDRFWGTDFLDRIGVKAGQYVLAVARLVPEKGLHDLIEAFKSFDSPFRLVIAGDTDHETEYSRSLKRKATLDDRIIMTGYITGEPLQQLFAHAGIFVMPSYHEGHPIALLEALSYGLQTLVSDIPANLEIDIEGIRYFRCGDIKDLLVKMQSMALSNMTATEKKRIKETVRKVYNWDRIADKTIKVYDKAVR